MDNSDVVRVWNFVLTGEVRSGAGAVLTSVNNCGQAICHADLFHASEAHRRAAHESYFGPSVGDSPEWYVEASHTSPWQYINKTVLDNPKRGEWAVGFYAPYAAVRRLELYDLFQSRWRAGDFSIVHVVRNPVACFVSLKQAEKTGVWRRGIADEQAVCPRPVKLVPEELVAFCRESEATRSKIRDHCEDRLEIHYRDLVVNYQRTMADLFDFVELPAVPKLASPGCKRLRNKAVADRVSNWSELRAALPIDVARHLDADDLF